MIAYLKGTLVSSTLTQAVIDVQGIGYAVLIPCSLMEQLPPLGTPVQLYTTLVIREQSHNLYGFLSPQERDVFDILLNVTGVGPKLALSLIGHLILPRLHSAVTKEDIPALCQVPGVGKKTAERLIIELRDKLPQFLSIGLPVTAAIHAQDPRHQSLQDATAALTQLGYSLSIAQKAVKQSLKELPEEADLASLIRIALRHV